MLKLGYPKGFEDTIRQVEAQVDDLASYSEYISSHSTEKARPEDTIFCGAGDSFACSLFIERYLGFKPRAMDPFDLFLHPGVARNKKVYFVSVSGRTKTNIEAAKLVRKEGAETIAITADLESDLAKQCSDRIELRFTGSKELTPGTGSFTTSLIACASIFEKLPRFNLSRVVNHARDWADHASNDDKTFQFVGSGPYYGIAVYAAAKIIEYAGLQTTYQLIEEFSHLNLFTLRRDGKDQIILFRDGPQDKKANELDGLLTEAGLSSILVPTDINEAHPVENAISYAIHAQLLGLEVALKRGLSRPSFLEDRVLLDVSNKMIY